VRRWLRHVTRRLVAAGPSSIGLKISTSPDIGSGWRMQAELHHWPDQAEDDSTPAPA
jgi:hypothetical protein